MKRRTTQGAEASRQALSALIIGFCMLILTGQSHGQGDIDLQAIAQETQKMSQTPNDLTLVWWVPEQFWQASLERDSTVTKAQVNQFLKTLRPYTMVFIVDGQMGRFGGITFTSEEAVRMARFKATNCDFFDCSNVTIKDAEGSSYAPLSESAVDPDTKNLLQIFKPIIVNMLGPMGQWPRAHDCHSYRLPGSVSIGAAKSLRDPVVVQ
jgi:hypothetical protein